MLLGNMKKNWTIVRGRVTKVDRNVPAMIHAVEELLSRK